MSMRALAVGCALFVAVPAAAALSIVKTCPADAVEAGTGFAYTITVTNGGTSAVSFHLHDALPDGVLFENLFVNGGFPGPETVCQLPTFESNDAPIECDYAGLAPGAIVEFTVTALLAYCLPGGITVTNSATATATGELPVSSQCGFPTLEQSYPSCNDFNACTDDDQCYDGFCQGQPINGCPDNNVCTIDGCDPNTGCIYQPIVCPEDSNPCTSAACHPITGCYQENVPAGTACPASGTCVAGGVCDGAGSCAPVSVCDDANPCTDDVTDYQNACACTHTATAAGTACSDASDCTSGDACDGTGHCVGAPVGVVPGEVGNTVYLVKFGSDFAAIRWILIANASYYQVVRGSLSGFPVGPGGLDEDCIRPEQHGEEGDDFDIPPPGTGVWYLVRGVNFCAGPGPWGFQGDHGVPGSPRVTTSCP